MGIRALISYEGEDAKELLEDFHNAVDDYLELCKVQGKEPEKPIMEVLMYAFLPSSIKKL